MDVFNWRGWRRFDGGEGFSCDLSCRIARRAASRRSGGYFAWRRERSSRDGGGVNRRAGRCRRLFWRAAHSGRRASPGAGDRRRSRPPVRRRGRFPASPGTGPAARIAAKSPAPAASRQPGALAGSDRHSCGGVVASAGERPLKWRIFRRGIITFSGSISASPRKWAGGRKTRIMSPLVLGALMRRERKSWPRSPMASAGTKAAARPRGLTILS